MAIFTKDFKKKWGKFCKHLARNFEINLFEGAGSIIGFVLSQFVWIWILNGFLGWFILWFMEVTEYYLRYTLFELKNAFWILYGLWFGINILTRLLVIKRYEED